MIKSDYHVHSDFSSDGKASMEQMVEQAIRLGLTRLCFTDHMDYDYPQQMSGYDFMFNIEVYRKKLSEIKEKYRSRIEILTGIELGLQPHIADRMSMLTDRCPFDFIIGSTHVADHMDPYYPQYWAGRTKEEGIETFYRTIVENCKVYQGFHVCGHIDYIVRYAPDTKPCYKEYSYERYSDVLDEILKVLLSYGKGIELNTAGYKYGLGHPHPKKEILKRYRELGGEIITIGSDAHRPEHLGNDFERAAELLRSLGYRYYTVFIQGQPVMEPL